MNHYVMGFIFNKTGDKVLLMRKNKPDWQAGRWNGIGGKIKLNETPLKAMQRECEEETNACYSFKHCLTFICPGGTVYVYKAFSDFSSLENGEYIYIHYEQDEKSLKEGTLDIWRIDSLPENIMNNLKWIIPICSANDIQYPVLIQENTLGVK